MAWLFGKKKTPDQELSDINVDHLPKALQPEKPHLKSEQQDLSNLLQAHKQTNSGGSGKGKPSEADLKYGGVEYRGLERAAQAAKELDNSKHVSEAITMAKEEEKTNQLKQQVRIEEYKLSIKRAEGEQIRIRAEEERRTQQERMQLQKEKSKFDDRLARQRDSDKLEAEKRTQGDILRAQEESIQKQEQLRRQTLEREMELRRENDMHRVEAEARAKAMVDRENHDIKMKEIRLEQEQTLKGRILTTEQWIKASKQFLSNNFGSGPAAISSCLIMGGMFTVFYGAKFGAKVVANYANARLAKPILVRETNRPSLTQPLKFLKYHIPSSKAIDASFTDKIIVNPSVHTSIVDIALGAQHTMKNNGYLRNVLLYGPPGTGKSLFARMLAEKSNMDYAIISGGDIAPLGGQAVTEIHNLWTWAESRNRGMILFIDEADAFLQKRNDKHGKMSENMRATVNAFLMKSGTESKKVMFVLASNQPEQLDWAINDRIDTSVMFPLPKLTERQRMVDLYYKQNILDGACNPDRSTNMFTKLFKSTRQLSPEDDLLDNQTEILTNVAENTDGLSGRQISKMITSWEHGLYASADGLLTREMIHKSVGKAMEDNKQRMKWLDEMESEARKT